MSHWIRMPETISKKSTSQQYLAKTSQMVSKHQHYICLQIVFLQNDSDYFKTNNQIIYPTSTRKAHLLSKWARLFQNNTANHNSLNIVTTSRFLRIIALLPTNYTNIKQTSSLFTTFTSKTLSSKRTRLSLIIDNIYQQTITFWTPQTASKYLHNSSPNMPDYLLTSLQYLSAYHNSPHKPKYLK